MGEENLREKAVKKLAKEIDKDQDEGYSEAIRAVAEGEISLETIESLIDATDSISEFRRSFEVLEKSDEYVKGYIRALHDLIEEARERERD